MKTSHFPHHLRACLLAGATFAFAFVAFMTASAARAQAPQTAAPTATAADATPAAAPAPAAASDDDDTVQMDVFSVNSDKDHGYLRANSVTATRIGMRIQRVPASITVFSSEFIQDTNMTSITDTLRFMATGAADNRFAMDRPANEATPTGNFTLRGFTVNSLMRDGVFRYTGYNLDNVDRVEVISGPAAVFFGQGYPGGVINYITKKPIFTNVPTTLAWRLDSFGGQKVTLDANQYFSPKAALRIVGAWTADNGERRFEYLNNFNITPTLTLIPFASNKLRLNLTVEHLQQRFNQNTSDWVYPSGWFAAYQNSTAALMTAAGLDPADPDSKAAYQTRIFNSLGNYTADVRKAANDPTLPLYTSIARGAFYANAQGQTIHDPNFNFTTRGAYANNIVTDITGSIEFFPARWLDARYVYTKESARYDAIEATMSPNADGMTFNTTANSSAGAMPGYYRHSDTHQIDLIFKKDFAGLRNKLLIGGSHIKYLQQYGDYQAQGYYYANIPGATNDAANQYINAAGDTVYLVPPQLQNTGAVPVNQVIRDRNGNIKRVDYIYQRWDPGYEIEPDVSKIVQNPRPVLDGYPTRNMSAYINLQIRALQDRLTILAGYRREWRKDYGQTLTANAPWFSPPADAYKNQDLYPPDVYNYSPSYSADPTNWNNVHGDSWMAGVSYELRKGINLYATVSKTFKFNFGNAGGYLPLTINDLLQSALDNGGGHFQYRGQTISSIDQGLAAIAADGATQQIPNEWGYNYEAGVKLDLMDSRLVASFAIFQAERNNQKLDDSQAQANTSEPFNYSTTLFAPDSPYYNTRNFRWRTVGVHNQIRGFEYNITWTPNRNWQTVFNGSWMPQAKTLNDPRYANDGSAFAKMYYGNRIENVPEFRVNLVSKYTIPGGPLRKLAGTLMARYMSRTIIARSFDYNPDNGGLTAGNFLVIDAMVSYPWELFGYKLTSSFGMYNIFDRKYIEGNNTLLSMGRSWNFITSVKF